MKSIKDILNSRNIEENEEQKLEKIIENITFKEFISQVISVKDDAWFNVIIDRDVISSKYSNDFRKEILLRAKSCGEKFANNYRDSMNKTISEVVNNNGIKYREELMPNNGTQVIFAEYIPDDEIIIYTDSLNKYCELINESEYEGNLTSNMLKKILIAHEFFHHIEENMEDELIHKKYKLWEFMGYSHYSTISSQSEIAAMVFAKKILEFDYCPCIVDCLLSYAYDKKFAYKIYEEAKKYNNKVN